MANFIDNSTELETFLSDFQDAMEGDIDSDVTLSDTVVVPSFQKFAKEDINRAGKAVQTDVYMQGDIVSNNENIFVCKTDNLPVISSGITQVDEPLTRSFITDNFSNTNYITMDSSVLDVSKDFEIEFYIYTDVDTDATSESVIIESEAGYTEAIYVRRGRFYNGGGYNCSLGLWINGGYSYISNYALNDKAFTKVNVKITLSTGTQEVYYDDILVFSYSSGTTLTMTQPTAWRLLNHVPPTATRALKSTERICNFKFIDSQTSTYTYIRLDENAGTDLLDVNDNIVGSFLLEPIRTSESNFAYGSTYEKIVSEVDLSQDETNWKRIHVEDYDKAGLAVKEYLVFDTRYSKIVSQSEGISSVVLYTDETFNTKTQLQINLIKTISNKKVLISADLSSVPSEFLLDAPTYPAYDEPDTKFSSEILEDNGSDLLIQFHQGAAEYNLGTGTVLQTNLDNYQPILFIAIL